MFNKNQLIVFFLSFFIFGFFFLSKPNSALSGIAGCCEDNNQCVGCESGCAISGQNCNGSFTGGFPGVYCVNPTGTDSMCVPADSLLGCCVHSPGNCENEITLGACQPVFVGTAWFFDIACSQVPQCTVPPIPTLNQWGTFIMAGVLGLFAVVGVFAMRRRNALTS